MPPRIPPSFSFPANTATSAPDAGPSFIPQAAAPAQPARLIDSLWPSGLAGQPDPHVFILPPTRSSPEDVLPLTRDAVNKLFAAIRASRLRSAPAPMVTPVEQPHGYANPHAPRTLMYLLPPETHTGMQAILYIDSGNALQRLELYKLVTPMMEPDGSVRVTHFEVPDLLTQTTPGHTYPPARGWTAALIDTARGTAVTAEPAHGRRRERPGSGSSENAPPAQRRKTHPAKASLPVPPALSLEEGLRVVHANGLVVEDQIAISSLHGTGNTCPSHAANHAFQGDAVGLALEGVHIGEIETAIAHDFGIAMQVMTAMNNPGEWIDGEHDLEMMADRLERGGTAIVELGGQDYTSGVTQHFVTLVRHAGDGRFHLLDSLNAHEVRSFATAREALRALAMVNELAGGRWALSALVPTEGRVLPPARLNPRGAYLPDRGFVPLADLQEEELQRVEEMHGPEARSRLEQAMAQHAGAAYAAGFLGQPVLIEAIPAAESASQLSRARWEDDDNQYGVWANRPGDEHPQSVSVALSGHGNDIDAARRAAEGIAAQIHTRTYVHRTRPFAEHTSDVRGVRWNEGQNRWIIQTTGPYDDKVQIVSVPINKHDNDVMAAKMVAEDIARRIQAGTYVHQPKPRNAIEHTSDVPGVSWGGRRKRWVVRIKRRDEKKSKIVGFHISKYGNNIDTARRAAEDTAKQIRAGTYVHKPKLKPTSTVEYTSDVPGVYWSEDKNRWEAMVEGSGGGNSKVTFPISKYGNDIDAARIAAEDIAAQIRAGTYVHQSKPRLKAEYTSDVRGVMWSKDHNRWVAQLKGPYDKKPQYVTFPISRYGNDIDAARIAAEGVAAQIRAGTYVHQPKGLAENTSHVRGVYWDGDLNRWVVQLKAPGDKALQFVSVPVSEHGNDIEAARMAAEDIAAQIHAGTYVHQPKP